MNNPVLNIDNLSYTYPGRAAPALTGVNLSLEAGECLCLTGPSGCGKSTLLRAVMGLAGEEGLTGGLKVNGPAPATGMVFQNVDSQLLCTTVADETAFAPRNLGLDQAGIEARQRAALASVGLTGLEERNVEELSAGQKQRVSLAAVLAMEPRLLLLDEPLAQLDGAGRTALVETLARLKAAGHALVISEHNLTPLAGLADGYGLLDRDGRWLGGGDSPLDPPLPGPLPGMRETTGQRPVVRAEGLVLEGRNGPVLDGADLTIQPGDRVHLFGANGAGKTTLLRCLAGLLRPRGGRLKVAGLTRPKPEKLVGRVGYLFQNPQRQLFEETVRAEIAFTLGRMGLSRQEREYRVDETLEMCRIGHLAHRPPLALSWGEQHRTALAVVLALRPELLLCDEPLAGLDWESRFNLLAVLARLAYEHGTAVVIASHDPLPHPDWAVRRLVLEGGRIARV